jgi:hypothetical protein
VATNVSDEYTPSIFLIGVATVLEEHTLSTFMVEDGGHMFLKCWYPPTEYMYMD